MNRSILFPECETFTWMCKHRHLKIPLAHVIVVMFTCHVREVREIERNEINLSFTASKEALDRNENSLEISLSATRFRWNYGGVPRIFARTITDCREISLSLKQ